LGNEHCDADHTEIEDVLYGVAHFDEMRDEDEEDGTIGTNNNSPATSPTNTNYISSTNAVINRAAAALASLATELDFSTPAAATPTNTPSPPASPSPFPVHHSKSLPTASPSSSAPQSLKANRAARTSTPPLPRLGVAALATTFELLERKGALQDEANPATATTTVPLTTFRYNLFNLNPATQPHATPTFATADAPPTTSKLLASNKGVNAAPAHIQIRPEVHSFITPSSSLSSHHSMVVRGAPQPLGGTSNTTMNGTPSYQHRSPQMTNANSNTTGYQHRTAPNSPLGRAMNIRSIRGGFITPNVIEMPLDVKRLSRGSHHSNTLGGSKGGMFGVGGEFRHGQGLW
jgi:hypothetical protein